MTKQSVAVEKDKVHVRIHQEAVRKGLERLDRHSGAGGSTNPPPKKGGQGKFNWGAPGVEEDYVEVLDSRDPNYVDPEEAVETEEKLQESRRDIRDIPEGKVTVEETPLENA